MDTGAVVATDLSDFLLARIAEDEARLYSRAWWPYGSYIDGFSPRRLAAECDAKRRIVAEHPRAVLWRFTYCQTCAERDQDGGVEMISTNAWPCPTVRFLALPYTDHPDYPGVHHGRKNASPV